MSSYSSISFTSIILFVLLLCSCPPFSAPTPSNMATAQNPSSSNSTKSAGGDHQKELSALEKHVRFFDRDNDGVISVKETYEGFRAIGCGVPLSSAASVAINTALSGKTRPGKPMSFQFPIVVENIALAKHGSHSGVFDAEGRYVPAKFEEIFSKHARTRPDALTENEVKEMLQRNKEPHDGPGWFAAFSEWKIIYSLCKDKDGFLHRETLRSFYDGTLFYELEKKNTSRSAAKKKA